MTGIVAARSEPGARHALRMGRYALRRGGETETRELKTVGDYREVLAGPIGIRLPDSPELDRRLERLVQLG